MCTDKETLQQLIVVEEFMHESHSRMQCERAKGKHELIIKKPDVYEGIDVYYEYLGLKRSLEKRFTCIHVEEKPDKLIVSI